MIRFISISIILTLLFSSCRDEELASKEPGLDFVPASLSYTIDMSDINVGTRGYADMEEWESAEGWSLWDKYVDGRLFYRLTVFLIDDKNTLVAYRDIYKGSGDLSESNGFLDSNGDVDTSLDYGDKARVTFLFSNPLHGDAEKLHRGKYRLMAVANFSECSATDAVGTVHTYSGLSLTSAVDAIKSAFNTNSADGIANFTTTYASNFINYRLDAGDDRVCAQQPMPLSLAEDINLSPGDNQIAGELIRTFARLRIVVENNALHDSKDLTLTVNQFNLSNNYAQRYAYLFGEPGNEDRFYENALSRGQINVSSSDAIKPFSQTNIGEMDTSNPQSNDAVIFDAYILESRDESNDYTYTLDLAYASKDLAKPSYTIGNEITNHGNVKAGKYYLIKRKGTNYYLAEGTNAVSVKNMSNVNATNVTEDMIWLLESGGTNKYYIKTIDPNSDTQYYMQEAAGSDIKLSSSRSGTYTLSTSSSSIRARYDSGSRYYITVDASSAKGVRTANNNCNLSFYEVTIGDAAVTKKETVVLKTIDEVTSQVAEVTNIRRNDFIDVLVTVSYVPDSENGHFTFEVEGWTKKSNNHIEFE